MTQNIYREGFIFEDYRETGQTPIGPHYTYEAKIECPSPHPFKDGQVVVEGVDYELKHQTQFGIRWDDCPKIVYDVTASQHRRIIAVPKAPEQGGEKFGTAIKKSPNDYGSNTYEKLYDLELHDQYKIGNNNEWNVIRVPGGWIYTYHRLDAGQMNSVFIPFDNEFMPSALPDNF